MKTVAPLLFLLFISVKISFSQRTQESVGEKPTEVVAVFPTSDSLPANVLRMYLQFSRPMRPFGNLERIKVLNNEGREVVGAIFNNSRELWNHEQTQLTLIFDPSRVKTGLKAHEELGRALQKGENYQLAIGSLIDANGDSTAPFSKSFIAAEEDVSAPSTDLWDIKMPKVGTQEPVSVRFPEPLDYLCLLQRLKLTDKEKSPLKGRIEIASDETEWRFYPDQHWREADYLLFVHTRLEDPSGNNLNGLFDHAPGTLKNDREGEIERINIKPVR